ncbi:type 1 glutamine amidotransferase domain-containing protein [Streptomyces sp. ICN441]|uniref:type 1 glutamine amidotransferase domain-containing protein n=1 Tax=Streptomyces sp. ICN441 TaxID=2558286 RepID=UPI001F10137C|nr:type 1 glutamine amidotransferase domain-containing protein [Streptomyces sp. ICN441]
MLRDAGHEVVFATEYGGSSPQADPLLLSGVVYRTYPAYVQDEVVAALDDPAHFERGPVELRRRGTASDDTPAFVVQDANYLSARWPGDAYLFARRFTAMLA